MQITLNPTSRAKLEDIMEQLNTYFDLEELTPEELMEALLDLGYDLIATDDTSMPFSRNKLIEYCGSKVRLR